MGTIGATPPGSPARAGVHPLLWPAVFVGAAAFLVGAFLGRSIGVAGPAEEAARQPRGATELHAMAVAKRTQATEEVERARGSRAAAEPTVIALAQPTSEMWPGQPANYRGLAFGASRDEARRIIQPFRCMDELPPGISYRNIAERAGKPEWEVRCLSSNSIGGVAFEDVFLFDHEKLVEVDFKFSPDQFGTLREAFEDKFGQPNRAETAEVRTLAGFKDDNETLYWLGKGVAVSLARYHRTVTEGIAHFTSIERLRKILAEGDARRARAKSDF